MLTDESLMPFGKHKGQKMANVDAGYLLFLYNQNVRTRTYGAMSDVMVYINDNLEALKKEK
jgi:uncharacterized protein (DUF3820 family)